MMKNVLSLFRLMFFSLVFTFIFSLSSYAEKIGIAGDIHNGEEAFKKALYIMKERGVSYFIGTGDYSPNLPLLKEIQKILGIEKQNIYLMLGNWEVARIKYLGVTETDLYRNISKYGKIIRDERVGHLPHQHDDEGYGHVLIDSKKIRVSHFPQHFIEDQYLQDKSMRVRRPIHRNFDEEIGDKEPFQEDTMLRNHFPDKDCALEIYAHTHKRAYFKTSDKVPVMNAGSLDITRSSNKEGSFVIYDTDKGTLEWIDVEEGKILEEYVLAEDVK